MGKLESKLPLKPNRQSKRAPGEYSPCLLLVAGSFQLSSSNVHLVGENIHCQEFNVRFHKMYFIILL